ncbi:hypothetical protein LTR97_012574 [Elasticomyces elasticus]|uniref:Uncharacterized protein n=1 Tax=Elasticomyces elasticus TaxID=574655 RepID=A0AAN7VZF4_9PEZI|nr:hypothetical protein LTR97_012574 [Elasticomyces elasticus]
MSRTSSYDRESSVDFLGFPLTPGFGPLEYLADEQQSFDMEQDRLGALDASRKRKNSDSLPPAKKPRIDAPVDVVSRHGRAIATEPPAKVSPLDDLGLRRRAIDSLDKATLQQLLLDATKKSITTKRALEVKFAEKQRDERVDTNDFSHFLDSVVEIWSSNHQYHNQESSVHADTAANDITNLLGRIASQVTVDSSYAIKRTGLNVLCEIGNWILKTGHCALGRGVQQHFEAHDTMAEAMMCVTDVCVDEEVWKIRADKEIQIAFKAMRNSRMLCVHEALTFVIETGRCSCPDCISV